MTQNDSVAPPDRRTQIARMYRRAMFGLPGGGLQRLVESNRPVADLADELVGAPPGPDPWKGTLDAYVPTDEGGKRRKLTQAAVVAWLDSMVTSPSQLLERVSWTWHGHFTSSVEVVKNPQLMIGQVRTLRRLGLGRPAELLRSIATDAAMLLYLEGARSTSDSPNEHFARELLEQYTVGDGAFTEDDVKAAAKVLSGWRVDRTTGKVEFKKARHDPTPRTLLGVRGVNDVASAVDAILRHPLTVPNLARVIARPILGRIDADVANELGATLGGRGAVGCARQCIDALLDGTGDATIALDPVTWFVAAQRATGGNVEPKRVVNHLRAAGQLPWHPPDPSGWKGVDDWMSSSTLVAQFNLATALVKSLPNGSPAITAADDSTTLAWFLGLESDFGALTLEWIRSIKNPRDRLRLALLSPEFAVS